MGLLEVDDDLGEVVEQSNSSRLELWDSKEAVVSVSRRSEGGAKRI
jgi:hypothetical protein